MTNTWIKVIETGDCIFEDWDDQFEMPICPTCLTEYQDCPCPGPHAENMNYKTVNGITYAQEINV